MRTIILALLVCGAVFGQCGSAGRLVVNAVTGLLDCTAVVGAGSGSVTSLTATSPIVITPSPTTTVGVISCPTCSAGTPGTPVNAIQFNNPLGTFAGSADYQWIDTALATPSAPTVTQAGTPGSTQYAYAISWNSLVGASITGSAQTTTTGAAALGNTDYNIINPGSCPSGAVSYSVFRTENNGSVPSNGLTIGLIPQLGTCGTPFHDTGLDSEVDPFTEDTSRGLYTTQRVRVTGYGDVAEPFAVFGQPISDFTADMAFAFEHAGAVFSASGSFNNLFYPLVAVAEGTTNNAVPTAAWILTSANGSGNQLPLLVTGETHGTATLNNQTHNVTSRIIGVNPNSTLTLGVHFDAQSVSTVGPTTSVVGFNAEDWSTKGSTSTYGFRSLLNSGTGVWAFYGAGTAASHFGGNVEVLSLTYNGHTCSLVANVITCP